VSALERLKSHYQNRVEAARSWQARGGKVVGYCGIDVPEELLLAAGVFPLRLTGEPLGSTALADQYVAPTFHPQVRSIFNRLLDGTYVFLDHVILTNSTETILRLFYCLREIKRLESYPALPHLAYFELLHTPYRTSARYNRDRVRDFKKQLERWTGNPIDAEALRAAIAVCNENRRLLQAVAQARLEPTPRFSGVAALQIIGTAMCLHKPEHNHWLRQVLDEPATQSNGVGPRLFVEGSSLDHTQFYELVEACGATIVAEDSDWGNRYGETLVAETGDPLDAIAERYHYKPPSPTKATIEARVTYAVQKAVEAKVDGALFFVLRGENPPAWDYPEQRQALEARGIPTLYLDQQPYALTEADALRARVKAFVQSLARAKGL
jgi:benzoyl-CoA reductase/2-hydroxyglutaryl-CoA dehydratase subunit BcrC/BadD/HgdB